jgi:hypothetical protein
VWGLSIFLISPFFITGLTEAEGSFSVTKDNRRLNQYKLFYRIQMLKRDTRLLYKVKEYFGCGNITFDESNGTATYTVGSLSDLLKIIVPHFIKYPLRGTKYLDFIDFIKMLNLIEEIRESSDKNIQKITASQVDAILENMNRKREFDEAYEPDHVKDLPLDSNYVSGFIEGDGSFILELSGQSLFRFSLSIDQKQTNIKLLNSFKEILKINSKLVLNNETGVLKLTKFGDKYFKEFLIPFFLKNPLHGNKLVQLQKIVLILTLKEDKDVSISSKLSQITEIWLDKNFEEVSVQKIEEIFQSLGAVKVSHNAQEVFVLNTSTQKITHYQSVGTCAKGLNISPKTIQKYLDKNIVYNGYILSSQDNFKSSK